jgi:catechol 2,3-dioxygenase-like lactoylglutathione lyase family enzyme
MAIDGLNHFTVLTDDVANTVRFYGSVLGLFPGERPNFEFPGAWLYAHGRAVLHIVGGRPAEALRAGVIDHVAFTARGLAMTLQTLSAHNVEHVCRRQVGSGAWQVFFFDPNGARVELDFAADESDRA